MGICPASEAGGQRTSESEGRGGPSAQRSDGRLQNTNLRQRNLSWGRVQRGCTLAKHKPTITPSIDCAVESLTAMAHCTRARHIDCAWSLNVNRVALAIALTLVLATACQAESPDETPDPVENEASNNTTSTENATANNVTTTTPAQMQGACETEAQVVRFTTSDGVELVADFTPAKNQNRGAVLLFHMIPPSNDRTSYPVRVREALAVVFAGGIENAGSAGMAVYREMMTDFMGTYLGHCSWLGVKRNLDMMPQFLIQFVQRA